MVAPNMTTRGNAKLDDIANSSMIFIRNINYGFAETADKITAYGINVKPKKLQFIFFSYLALLFCLGALWEHTNSASVPRDPSYQVNKLNKSNDRPYNILTLGGSVTWGAKLENELAGYPHLINKLGNHKITNKAIETTSAFYPSICIESLMRGDNEEYDIIIFEFSLSGSRHLDMLVKRLQYRFPHAIFIYVHLYSLRAASVLNKKDDTMVWTNKELTEPGIGLQSLVKEIGGYIYNLPAPNDPREALPWFTPEMTHLSAQGHEQVAQDLTKLFNNVNVGTPVEHKHQSFDNKWGYGDECLNWFTSGKVPFAYRGGIERKIPFRDPTDSKEITPAIRNVLEFKRMESSSITVRNNLKTKTTVPVFFSYVLPAQTKLEVDITIGGKTMTLESRISPYTVVEITEVGEATDGMNMITINVKESTEVFQLVGVAFYGFRHHVGLPFKKMHNTIEFQDASQLLM